MKRERLPPLPVRALVVEDDPAIGGYLTVLLQREGIAAECVEDGRAAARRMRRTTYDVLFLDLLLPHSSGEEVLAQLAAGRIHRPGAIAVMSARRNLAVVDGSDWCPEVTFLPKPFTPGDVRAFLERAIGDRSRSTGPHAGRPVLIGGCGLWADELSRRVSRRGGRTLVARGPTELIDRIRTQHPAVVVIGAPLLEPSLLAAAVELRDDPLLAGATVLVGVDGRTELDEAMIGALGVDRIFRVPEEIQTLEAEILRIAGIARRVHPRVPLVTPVLLRAGQVLGLRTGIDLGEGGLRLHEVASRLARERALQVEFSLPATDPGKIATQSDAIVAQTEVVWRDGMPGERMTLGLRFIEIHARDQERIRSWMRRAAG